MNFPKAYFNFCNILFFIFSFIFLSLNLPKIVLADDLIVTGKVLGAPIKPLVSGRSICSNQQLSIFIDWPSDENSDNFEIQKNGETLAIGLINSEYTDSGIVSGISNSYQVIAYGPMSPGIALSSPITVATPIECLADEPVFMEKIETLENKPLSSYSETPAIKNNQPSFSGKTNIGNAKIEITLSGSSLIYQTIFANSNGFWSWQVPQELKSGNYTILTRAIHPHDNSITASDSLYFKISSDSASEKENDHHSSKTDISPEQSSTPALEEAEFLSQSGTPPFQLTVAVENFNHLVFIGEKLSALIDFSQKSSSLEDKDYQIFYEILNSNNDIIYIDSSYVNILRSDPISKKIPTSILAHPGQYHIRVKAYDGKILIAGENYFTIKELPIINIGFCKLSFSQIIQNYSWLLIGLLLILFFFINKEHHQSEGGIYQVTEKYLKKSGFFSKKDE